METHYRCMRCGMNLTLGAGEIPDCTMCKDEAIFVIVTEQNKNKLPHATNPQGMADIDFNDPGKNCQCATGRCPCGKYVAHAVSEPCIANEYKDIEV